MTKYELMVIAAAAAAFVIINILMWSIIAAKNKKTRKAASPETAVQEITPAVNIESKTVSRDTAAPVLKQNEQHREKRSDFILLDDIVITHTNERI